MADRFGDSSPNMSASRVPDPEDYVRRYGSFDLSDPTVALAVKPFEGASNDIRSFSTKSDPIFIRAMCKESIPGWAKFRDDEVAIDQVCEGLSNQLFKVHVKAEQGIRCVLFRIYGKDVATLYDQDLEMKIFNMLAMYQVAPQMFGNGDGWRIEEWHFSVPLKTKDMMNPSISSQVASALGRVHKLSKRSDFPRDILDCPPCSVSRLGFWADGCHAAAVALTDRESKRILDSINLAELKSERDWLTTYMLADDPKVQGAGLDIIFSHNDSQENNILQTHYGLRLIDFEYSGIDYQAYDIANYFCECMYDYAYDRYPYYKSTRSDYPSEMEQRLFCTVYLSEYLECKMRPDDIHVTLLYDRVKRFSLVSHYLWAVWSVIRAPQSHTFNEFDFLHYAEARFDAYKREKRALLDENPSGISPGTMDEKLGVRKLPSTSQAALAAAAGGGIALLLLGQIAIARLMAKPR